MTLDLVQLVWILAIAFLMWYANANLNPSAALKRFVEVGIVVITGLLLLQSVFGRQGSTLHVHG